MPLPHPPTHLSTQDRAPEIHPVATLDHLVLEDLLDELLADRTRAAGRSMRDIAPRG